MHIRWMNPFAVNIIPFIKGKRPAEVGFQPDFLFFFFGKLNMMICTFIVVGFVNISDYPANSKN